MKKALISPIEIQQTGYRVAEVVDQLFEVAPPLFWVDCADDVVADQFWYDPNDQLIKPVPVPEIKPAENQPTTTGAQTL
jgi:hypothetical protein